MKEVILNYITNQVSEDFEDEEIGFDDDLLGSGLVDSLGMMRLIQFIEEEFSVSVPPEDMTIDNFMTVAHISDYLEKK